VICDLIDIVSKNGMMLLNVGPKPDGTFTDEETAVLRDLGRWLKINGEGIYDTTPWKWFCEGKVNAEEGFFMDGEEKPFTAADFRFTYHGGCLYAFWLRPHGNIVCIRTLASKWLHDFGIEAVSLLGSDTPVDYTRDEDGLHIRLLEAPTSELPLCFRIQLA
jgi:alpha-L-fucosidase